MASPLVYTVCDRAYFDEHAAAFRKSAEKHGHQVRIDLVDDDDNPGLRLAEPRCLYSALRFLRLPDLLREHESVLVMDIDSVFNGPVEIPAVYDLGLYFRIWMPMDQHKVLLSASYWTSRAIPFAETVRDTIASDEVTWCCEQTAAWETYLDTKGQYRVLQLRDDFLNYDFNKPATIWTGKGGRKYRAEYLERKAEYA